MIRINYLSVEQHVESERESDDEKREGDREEGEGLEDICEHDEVDAESGELAKKQQ